MPPRGSKEAHARVYAERAADGSNRWNRIGTPENPEPDHYSDLKQFIDSPYLPQGGLVLDVGCGGGQASFLLAKHWLHAEIDDFSICGIDFVPEAIEMAESNRDNEGLDNHAVVFGICEIPTEMPTIDGDTADLIIDNNFFHCLVDQAERAAFLSECARILKSGGIIFLKTMLSTNLYLAKYDYRPSPRNAAGFQSFETDHRYYVDRDELFEDLDNAGFDIIFDTDSEGDIALYARRR